MHSTALRKVAAKLRALLAADLIDDVVFAGGCGLQHGADGDGEVSRGTHPWSRRP